MFALSEFLRGLDRLYETERGREAEGYLKKGLKAAAAAEDDGAVLAILNELMGYYRAASRYEECLLCVEQGIRLADSMGLSGTLDYGTMLLNAATGYRAARRYPEAERYYKEAEALLERHLPGPDYRKASLHNNVSLLYSETGRLSLAKEELRKAMEQVRGMEDALPEVAITHVNLGNLCFRMNQISEGTRHMEEANRIFESMTDHKDSHYASALAGLGEACFHSGDLERSVEFYSRALKEIETNYGKNDYYRITEANRTVAEDLLKRQRAVGGRTGTGLERARRYYEAYGKPMLLEKYPQYAGRIAAGLVGEGSECLGFDDPLSTDHDYGPGFCLWLTREDYEAVGKELQADYEALPGEFEGVLARNVTRQGAGRVGVLDMDRFYRERTGFSESPRDLEDWLEISMEALGTVTNGAVFEDPMGEFTRRREGFGSCPEPARLRRLAMALGTMAQAGQYNFNRARRRGDTGAMFFSLAEFAKSACDAVYLLNRTYGPFYKWRVRGLKGMERAGEVQAMLEELLERGVSWDGAGERIEEICQAVARELKSQGLCQADGGFLEEQKEEVLRRAEALEREERFYE